MANPLTKTTALNAEEMYHTDMPVGEILRRAREHYRQSLIDVERALRIKSTQIAAIESGEIDRLPGRVYAFGFVRSYAEYLGLDGDKMVQLFKSQYGRSTVEPTLDFPVAASESKTPPLWLLGICAIVVLGMSAAWLSFRNTDRTDVTRVPDVQEALKFDNAILSSEAYGPYVPKGYDPEVEVKEAKITPDAPEGVTLVMTENSWVEIKDKSGNTLVSQVLKAGDQYFVPNRPDLTMSLGNAGGVSVEISGEKLSKLGAKGTVMRDIPLDIEYLQKTFKTSSKTEN